MPKDAKIGAVRTYGIDRPKAVVAPIGGHTQEPPLYAFDQGAKGIGSVA